MRFERPLVGSCHHCQWLGGGKAAEKEARKTNITQNIRCWGCCMGRINGSHQHCVASLRLNGFRGLNKFFQVIELQLVNNVGTHSAVMPCINKTSMDTNEQAPSVRAQQTLQQHA